MIYPNCLPAPWQIPWHFQILLSCWRGRALLLMWFAPCLHLCLQLLPYDLLWLQYLTCPYCWSLLCFMAIYRHLFLAWTAHTLTLPHPWPLTAFQAPSLVVAKSSVPPALSCYWCPHTISLSCHRLASSLLDCPQIGALPFRISITYLACWPTRRSLPLLVAKFIFYMWGLGAGARRLVHP